MTLSLLLVLIGPIAQSQAASPAAAAPAAAGTDPDPSVEPEQSLEPDPAELPADDPFASDVAVPSEDVPSDSVEPLEEPTTYDTNITISKWLCPSGYEYTDPDSRPDEDCTEPLDGISFDLTQTAPDSNSFSSTTGEQQSGTSTFSGFDPGSWELTEVRSPYGSDGFRVCADFGFGSPGAESANVGEPFSFEVPEDEPFNGVCNWYNVPSGNSITIDKWLCPSGYDDATQNADPQVDCTEALDGIEFTLYDQSSSETTATTGDESSGRVVYDGLDSGDYEVAETGSPDPYDRYIIRCYTGNQDWLADYETYGLDESYPFSFQDGQSVDISCNWYDIPGGNTITIYKWLCPANYDYQAEGASPVADCTEGVDGVDFTLYGPADDDEATLTTGSVDPGAVRFEQLDTGDYEIEESNAEASYSSSIIRCGGSEPLLDFRSYQPGERLGFFIDDDGYFGFPDIDGVTENISCDWYNVPAGNTITIYKWLCPAQYDYTDPESRPDEDCTEALDGIDFSLTGPAGGQTMIATTGDVDYGIARFSGFGAGEYELSEVSSPYATEGFRVCNDFGFGNPGAEPAVVGEPFSFEVPTDAPFNGVCNWYNIQSGNSVTVYKWLCPYGYDYQAYQANPELDCAQPVDGVDFTLTPTGPSGDPIVRTTGSDGPGWTTFTDLGAGDYGIAESRSPYQTPGFLSCYLEGTESTGYLPIEHGNPYPFTVDDSASYHLICNWYNFPYDNSITIHKWTCPYGYDYRSGSADPYADCTEVTNAVEFTVSNLESTDSDVTGNDGPGTVVFDGLSPAVWNVEETVSPLYSAVVTGDCYEEGSEPTGNYGYGDGVWDMDVEIPTDASTHWVCDWFNMLNQDPGDVVIYKWTCPAGYDIYGYGANAAADCREATNGVRYNATGPGGYTSQSDTGDAIDGAVMFGGIEPGDYTFTETLPTDTLYVFIADCTGTSVDVVHPYPLYVGNPLLVRVNPGDRIVCNWYNVPKLREGTIVLTKYICSTPTYTNAVDCEIYEGGVSFRLLFRQSGDLVEISTGKTGANGQLTWMGLSPGQYTVQEEGGPYCRITASQIDQGYIGVLDGTTTYVSVYNCTSKSKPSPGTSTRPKPSNAPPGKFPNTGVDPNAAVGRGTGPLAGEPSPSPDQTINQTDPAIGSPSGSVEPSSCAAPTEPNDAGSPSPSASGSASPSPSPREREVTAASLAPSPDADVEACERGPVPANIVVEAVEMNLDIEVIETVDGVMQAPTGAEFASWYRETSRLGESGPIVIAGHLNYWNTPEGPFYALAKMEAGDLITVTGDDGGVYQYVVRSTEQFPSDASPNELFASVDQSAGGETMVLITCGGEWDASISEYNERTVVVATRVPVEDSQG